MSKFDGLSSSLTLLEKQLDEVQKVLGIGASGSPRSEVPEEVGGPANENLAVELLNRIKRLEEVELPFLRADCDLITEAKQDLINAYKTIGLQNRRQLMTLQVAAGVTQMPSEGPFTSLLSMMSAWDKEESALPGENDAYHIVKSVPETSEDKKSVGPVPVGKKKKKRGIHSFEEM